MICLIGLLSACEAEVSGDTTGSTNEVMQLPAIPQVSNTAVQSSPLEGCVLSAEQEAMLARVNDERSIDQVCGSDAYPAAAPLTWNCQILGAATRHSDDMAVNDFFSHTGSDGLEVDSRVDATGYDWRSVGENIAAGYDSIDAAVTALMNSPGHCANIMNPVFEDFAMALSQTNRRIYPTYWTQVFATPAR